MRICLVGYGTIAARHMEVFCQMPAVRPAVLVGRREEPTAQFAREWGFDRHTLELSEALADNSIDAVVITSPNELHVPQARAALEVGKHVLLEIPMAMNLADAEKIAALAREVDRRLMICHTMRTVPCLEEVRRRVATGELTLRHIVGFTGIMRQTNTSLEGRERSWTDNILWHHAAHLVDLSMWVCGTRGPWQRLSAIGGPVHRSQGLMDLQLSFKLSGDVLVNHSLSYNHASFQSRVLFVGEEETLEYEVGTLYDADRNVIVPNQSISDLGAQNREFVDAVTEDREPAIPAEAILPTMRLLQEAEDRLRVTDSRR